MPTAKGSSRNVVDALAEGREDDLESKQILISIYQELRLLRAYIEELSDLHITSEDIVE